MPCEVSLLELVRIEGTRALWPAAFNEFVKKIEAEPNERTHIAVLADWLGESEIKEPWLERACRYLVKRPETTFALSTTYSTPYWKWATYPEHWKYGFESAIASDKSTFAGLLAELALHIKKRIEELE